MATPFLKTSVSGRDLVSFYRSLSIMLSAGIPLYSCFDFLSKNGENPEVCQASTRLSLSLAQGHTLHVAAGREKGLFSQKAVRLLEAGYKSGSLVLVLKRLADDEEEAWTLMNQLKSELTYPLGIALMATLAVVLLPPLVLNDLLAQVVQLTSEPPLLTRLLMSFSSFLGSPWVLGGLTVTAIGMTYFVRTPHWLRWKDELEPYIWDVPALGNLWQSLICVRFLSVFALTYECGLPVTQCLVLSSSATGSRKAHESGERMKRELVNGGTLRDAFEIGEFLPPLAVYAVESGQQSGSVSGILKNSSAIIKAELRYRVEGVTKLVEPLVLAFLGVVVGVFALGCLFPIIKLAETL